MEGTAGHTTVGRYGPSESRLSQNVITTRTPVEVGTNLVLPDKAKEHDETIREVEQCSFKAAGCTENHVIANSEESMVKTVQSGHRSLTDLQPQTQ